MREVFTLMCMAIVFDVSCVYGQKSTEMYIPVGQSPGLSNRYASNGTMEKYDTQARALTCKDSAGVLYTFTMDQKTKIWLDKSKLMQSNVKGSYSDCKQGMLMEVKYKNNERKPGAVAEWIKIQVTQ
jgi:hypothetical protein